MPFFSYILYRRSGICSDTLTKRERKVGFELEGADIAVALGVDAAAPEPTSPELARGVSPALVALCTLARLHQVAADPATRACQKFCV